MYLKSTCHVMFFFLCFHNYISKLENARHALFSVTNTAGRAGFIKTLDFVGGTASKEEVGQGKHRSLEI